MPQRSLHPLVYILLMWITIISIVQVVFIAFFFTLGQNSQSLSHRAEKPGGTNDPLVGITSPTTAATTVSKQGMMLNFKANGAKEAIFWVASNPNQNLISESGKELDIKRDGYYFLSLRVTLSSCEEAGGSNPSPEHTVKLKLKSENKSEEKVLLEGGIDKQTNSSGQLSKVKGLAAGGKLEVTISPQTMCLNTSEAVTHLDVIFMQ